LTTSGIIGKQRRMMESVRTEHQKLQAALTQLQAERNSTEYKLESEREALARRECVSLEESVYKEECRSDDLASAIDLLRQRHATLRTILGNSNTAEGLSKYMSVLETRLERSNIRLNELAHANATLRESVDACRREKSIFAEAEKKIVEEHKSVKQQSSDLIEEISAAYAAKDKALTTLSQMRTIADREYLMYDKEWSSLNLQLEREMEDHDNTVRQIEFLVLSSKQAVVAGSTVDPLEDRFVPDDGSVVSLPPTSSVSQQAVERVLECTGFESIEKFISQFTEMETKTYSLINWSNQLGGDIERAQVRNQTSNQLCLLAGNHEVSEKGSTTPTFLADPSNLLESEQTLESVARIISRMIGSIPSGPIEERVIRLLSALDGLVGTSTRRTVPVIPRLCLPSSIALVDDENSPRNQPDVLPLKPLSRPSSSRSSIQSRPSSTRSVSRLGSARSTEIAPKKPARSITPGVPSRMTTPRLSSQPPSTRSNLPSSRAPTTARPVIMPTRPVQKTRPVIASLARPSVRPVRP
jgi:hypothetical protein